MSYTETSGHPKDLTLYCDQSGDIRIKFTCPRCNLKVDKKISTYNLIYGLDIECRNGICAKPYQRAGYILTLDPRWEERILGESDRPLGDD